MKWLTAVGLLFDIAGVILIFWSSKKAKSPGLSDALRYGIFEKTATWGLGVILIGFVFQLVGAIWPK
ncbi:MAG: hypothetical protein ACFFCW_18990 [Candidatus Hodarchaeota archaeon]